MNSQTASNQIGRGNNVLVIMSDEHNPAFLGCAAHPFIHTPHLDQLAARGTRFTQAYTCSPICVPARASFAIGRYVHEVGFWDNGDAYDGSVPSWHHVLRGAGHEVTSIGKLHFRGRAGDDHGFSAEQIPMHVVNGIGDIKAKVRDNAPTRKGAERLARDAGPGETTYTHYDRDIVSQAQIWLQKHADAPPGKPWVLFVSLVAPHFPLTAPPEWFYHYADMALPMPKLYGAHERPHHPFTDEYARVIDFGSHFRSDDEVRRAIAGYSGLVSFMDEGVGKILRQLKRCGLEDNTTVIYTSDHGDNLGARGLWGKSTFYEESAGVPMLIAGPGIAAGAVVRTPVSHVDCAVTILQAAGAPELPLASGHSLLAIAQGATPSRPVISEYHAAGSATGGTMLRHKQWKYCHYVGLRPQLFNLKDDPEELRDLATDPEYASAVAECEHALRGYMSPEKADATARARQQEFVDSFGGREGALKFQDFAFSPAPGTKPIFN